MVAVECGLPVWRTLRQDPTPDHGGVALVRDSASSRQMPIKAAPIIDQVAVQPACKAANPTEVSMPEAPRNGSSRIGDLSVAGAAPRAHRLQASKSMQPLDIAASLPPTERTAFLEDVAEGEALLQVTGGRERFPATPAGWS